MKRKERKIEEKGAKSGEKQLKVKERRETKGDNVQKKEKLVVKV
jgi:hypothetical protein